MSSEPRAFATIDHGTATVAVSLIGRVDGRWRLLDATAAPAAVPAEVLLHRLRAQLDAADPALARSTGLGDASAIADLPLVQSRTTAPPALVVVAATERVARPMAAAATAAGWRVRSVALEGSEILRVASMLADPSVSAVLAGASDPPGADERPLAGELIAIVAAAVQRRPELTLVLAGGMAVAGRTEALVAPDRPGSTLLAPAVATAAGARLRDLLDGVRAGTDDGRRALAASTQTLAEVLRRRVEVVEIGQTAGARVAAAWSPGTEAGSATSATVAEAALVPPGADEAVVDEVAAWLTIPVDRLRLRDRMQELVLAPWGDLAGDGALLRMAAARAALARLVAATPAIDALPVPDLVVAAGGTWALAPGPAVGLAIADVVRRPGVRALGLDHARLLGPLGTIEDPQERQQVISDLRDELLVPLGSVVIPAGLHAGRSVGRLEIRSDGSSVDLDLVAGGLELVDLPPGTRSFVDLKFRDAVDLGTHGRHFAAEVAGGLGGLLVDLRDVPLRLPDRPERRRELLAAWQSALWVGAAS